MAAHLRATNFMRVMRLGQRSNQSRSQKFTNYFTRLWKVLFFFFFLLMSHLSVFNNQKSEFLAAYVVLRFSKDGHNTIKNALMLPFIWVFKSKAESEL